MFPQTSYTKLSATLFSPELYIHYQNLLENKEYIENVDKFTGPSEMDQLFVRAMIIMQTTCNDEHYYKTNGIFKQFCAEYHMDLNNNAIITHDGRLNLLCFDSNKIQLSQLYKFSYESEEEMANSLYLPFFLLNDEFKWNKELRINYIKNVLREIGNNNSSYFDPTFISIL